MTMVSTSLVFLPLALMIGPFDVSSSVATAQVQDRGCKMPGVHVAICNARVQSAPCRTS